MSHMRHMPPVPKQNRSTAGPGEPANMHAAKGHAQGGVNNTPDKTGHQANTKINTTHQGLQQDR